jgi:hypothetical protein
MRRALVTSLTALALALAPAALFAQTAPPAQQPPTQPPTTQPPAAEQPAPKPPQVTFASQAGILLVQIKPDQTAVFEEMVSKLQAGLAKTEDTTLQQQASGMKVYKSAEPMGANALYVIEIDTVVPNAEYDLFAMLNKTMTVDEQRAAGEKDPATNLSQWERYAAAFAAGLGKLSLTPITGAGM